MRFDREGAPRDRIAGLGSDAAARLVPGVVIEHVNLEDSPFARHDPERLVRAVFQRVGL